ncbi:MAG: protoheme IX farnesyltransferase [Bacteroidota bacterium]
MTANKHLLAITSILELSKVKITVAVSFTTITGYLLASKTYNLGFILPTLGIFLLACSSSVINHLQEAKTDAKMERTKQRPIPSGRISTQGAAFISVFQFAAGSFLLLFSSNLLALMLAWLALVWYNFIYTPLKKITPNAVIPGSVIGAIPPLVGWVAAGGPLLSADAWIMALFFFIWQVPHFYLLVLKYGKQYEEAGFPSLTQVYTDTQIKRIIFYWILGTVTTALILPLFGLISSTISLGGLIISCIWILTLFVKMIRSEAAISAGRYFMRINYFVLVVILLLAFDQAFINL